MLHTIKTSQFLKSDLNTIWEFMRSPDNLSRITPPDMAFSVISNQEDISQMYPGLIIEYYVTPMLGLKLHWVTEITQVEHLQYFVDEQRFGPYAFWHHKHFLKAVEGGVEMTDIVHYKLPLGFIGRIAHALFVKKQLKSIFDYRFNKLEELFNQKIVGAGK